MKHFLRLMGQLCPISNLYKTKLSAMMAVTTLFMCLIAAIKAPAQTGAAANMAEIQPLQIGDTIPEELWHLPEVISKAFVNMEEENNIKKILPDADLFKYPVVKYEVITEAVFECLKKGDSIPDKLWQMPLWVVNTGGGKDTITLEKYRSNKLVVLDFWASWCAPCVKSMEDWEQYRQIFGDRLSFMGVHMDYDYKALPFIKSRGWTSASIIGGSARIINRCFFPRATSSRLVWIVDGRLLAITGTTGYDKQMIEDIINGKKVTLPQIKVGL